MMKKSIIGGFMISMGAGLYLTIGGPLGAFLFAIGLLTILHFQFNLFTGKAGLLVDRKIKVGELFTIWIGNFVGSFAGSALMLAAGLGPKIIAPATAIIEKRISNCWY